MATRKEFNYIRGMSSGNYDVDLSNIKSGETFPSNEVRGRNRVYRYNKSLYDGTYSQNKNLVAMIDDSYREINFKVLPMNYFKLVVSKIDSLLFSNEININTGNFELDNIVNKLVERTHWVSSIRRAVRYAEIYGDACMKTYRNGVSVVKPTECYKVVNEHNKDEVRCYVLREILYERINNKREASKIRLLIVGKGFEYERVYEYDGNDYCGKLGKPVRYKYNNRWIPKDGLYTWTHIKDAETVQWLSVNIEKDGVYGTSSFEDIKDLVLAIETRLSTENWILDAHGKPLLLVGMSSLKTDETTGQLYLSVVNGKYMVDRGGDLKPEYLTWDGKLEESANVREALMQGFYELSELGKTFLSGEYTGNVSEESLNNIIKSAIDRGNRELNDFWYEIRKSLYVLCRLNDIDVSLEDINIDFNIGRSDDNNVVANVCETLSNNGLFSKRTLLKKFWRYNDDDVDKEFELMAKESEVGTDDKLDNNDSIPTD